MEQHRQRYTQMVGSNNWESRKGMIVFAATCQAEHREERVGLTKWQTPIGFFVRQPRMMRQLTSFIGEKETTELITNIGRISSGEEILVHKSDDCPSVTQLITTKIQQDYPNILMKSQDCFSQVGETRGRIVWLAVARKENEPFFSNLKTHGSIFLKDKRFHIVKIPLIVDNEDNIINFVYKDPPIILFKEIRPVHF